MKKSAILLSALILFAPYWAIAQTATTSASAPYNFARQGVFGCNLTGSYAMSVGAMSAVGGVYVPVNDAAVTLNTGYLVYKECVLRGIVDREKESVIAALTKKISTTIQTGANGDSLMAQQPSKELLIRFLDPTNLKFLQNIKDPTIQRVLARSYMTQTRRAADGYTCPYGTMQDMQRVWSGEDTSEAARAASSNPLCDPVFGTFFAQRAMDEAAAQRASEVQDCLDWGRGFYCLESTDEGGEPTIVTPSSLIQTGASESMISGFRIAENANDIDQMPGALLAGLMAQVMSSARGLVGLSDKIGSQPSYLDQVAAESAAGLRNAAANAGIQTLNAAKQVETTYNQIVTTIANTLTSAITALRGVESSCWKLIVEKVCVAAPAADGTCTAKTTCTTQQVTDPNTGQTTTQQNCPTGATLKIATSTAYSQQVIDSQITPLANQTVTNINTSNNTLKLINQLIAGVTNTTSADAMRLAIIQLDQLVSQGALHNQTQLTTVQQQQAAIKDSMTTLVSDTKTAWGDSTDTSVGWCNVNNPSVVQMWIQRWTK